MMIHQRRREGFTLVELLVVVLIIGILAALAVPSYMKSVETAKADDAVALVNMIGTTNKMFALDHGNNYIRGQFPTSANTGCGSNPCQPTTYTNACNLVWCKYLADQNFGSKPYTFYACNGGASATCGTTLAPSGLYSAGARNKSLSWPYFNWAYTQNSQGVITAYGSAPTPTY